MNQPSATSQACGERRPESASHERQAQGSSVPLLANLSIGESPSGYVIEVDVPGVPQDDIAITVDDGVLEVSGNRSEPDHGDYRKVFSNRGFGSFRRAVRLPEDVDAEQIDASLVDGVLRISLQRVPESQPRRVEIRVPSA